MTEKRGYRISRRASRTLAILLVLLVAQHLPADEAFDQFWSALDEMERTVWVDGIMRGLTFAGPAVVGIQPESDDARLIQPIVRRLTWETDGDRKAVNELIVEAITRVAASAGADTWDTGTIVAVALDLACRVIRDASTRSARSGEE